MKIIFYSSTINASAVKLVRVVLSVVPEEQLYFSGDITEFISVLLECRQTNPIVVIQLITIEEAAEMRRFSELFDDFFFVIVTDKNPDLLAKCRKLYPRLVCQDEDDFEVLSAVIQKRYNAL